MPVYIQNIAAATPEGKFKQVELRDRMKTYINGSAATKRIIHSIYSRSGIESRHTVVDDLHTPDDQEPLFLQKNGVMSEPSTKVRNDIYITHAKKLFVDVARQLVQEDKTGQSKNITHIITVSCTGFFAPGPAYEIVKKLGLSPATERFHVGFMGCFGVFPALKMAYQFCRADPDATVLVVSVELCTLHLQASAETDQLISASVFADGAAGAIISSQPPADAPALRIEQFQSAIADDSEDEMSWKVGDTGFEMVLSTYVPQIIEANIRESITPLLNAYDLQIEDIIHWPVHPGGRAILDKIQQSLALDPAQLGPSREVLAHYGNMSSATILFVLKKLLNQKNEQAEESALAMAFGPGLTIETALLTKISLG